MCCSHREHQEAFEELKRKSERNKTLLEEENKKLQAEIDKVRYLEISELNPITLQLYKGEHTRSELNSRNLMSMVAFADDGNSRTDCCCSP